MIMDDFTPKTIGRIPIVKTPYHKNMMKNSNLGDLDDSDFAENDPVHSALCDLCESQGYMTDNDWRRGFNSYGYIHGIGSIFPHADKGMGLTVCALVAIEKITRSLGWSFADLHKIDGCALIYDSGVVFEIMPGDVFVFDADRLHAWMANCRWVLALQAVRLQDEDS